MSKISGLIQTALLGLKTSYALVDSARHIIEHGAQFPIVAESNNLVGRSLFDLFPELIGQEEALNEVERGHRPSFRLENLNRKSANEAMSYLTLTITPGQPDEGMALVVMVSDVTEQGEQIQQLMQSRNELHLTRRNLAKLNDQLDYLLHHYVPPDVVFGLLQGQIRPELGGEVREISVLFADIRNFTPLAEKLPPDRVVQLLNEYLTLVTESIDEVDGTISQFQGDNMMVMFNATIPQSDHVQRAVQAGVNLQHRVMAYQSQQPPEIPRLNFGVGISTGAALVGNIGAHRRYTYTAIGDTVNLAARITANVPANEVWISQATAAQLYGAFEIEALHPLKLKGKKQPAPIFRVQV
jgi:adenylate cyclase